jgi:hypothetical protein
MSMSTSRSMCIHVHVAALVLWRSGGRTRPTQGRGRQGGLLSARFRFSQRGVGRYLGTSWPCRPQCSFLTLSLTTHSLPPSPTYPCILHCPLSISTHPFTPLTCLLAPAVASRSRTHAHHHARRPCLCPPAPFSAAPSSLVFEKVWQKGCADMALCCPRSALGLHCSHGPMVECSALPRPLHPLNASL